MTHEDQGHKLVHEWWKDAAQRANFEERFGSSKQGRRTALTIIGAFAGGAAVVACGGSDDKKTTTTATQAPAGAASAAAGAAQPAAGEKLAKNQTLRYTERDEPATFDYNFNLYAMAWATALAGVLKFDADFNVKPDIAESFSVNATGDQYTFKIRKDSKWSDGTPLTAKDYVYSWTRRLDPTSGADYAAFLYDIKNGKKFNNKEITDATQLGVKATDDSTLVVTTEGPAGYFPALAAYTAAFPANEAGVKKYGDKYGQDADKFVSNGPFKLTKWDHNKSWEMSKNENYWDAKNIKLDKVTFLIVKVPQRVTTYENNEIDIVPSANVGDLKRLTADPKLSKEIFKFDQVGTWYLMPNPKFKPFDNPKVRLAMAHAIDRERLVKDVIAGLGSAAYTMNPAGTSFFNPNKYDEFTKYDPKLAMDQLKGTEYEGGKNWPKITISMRNNEADAHQASMAAIVQMFKENLGMTIDSELGDPQALYKEMRQGNKQLMWLRWYMDYPDANNTSFECFYSKIPAGSRRSWWENAAYDKLVEDAQREPAFEKRKVLYAQADEVMIKEAGAVFAYYPLAYGLQKPTVRGVPKNKAGQLVPDWNIYQRMMDSIYMVEA